jgi:hypothetical protein
MANYVQFTGRKTLESITRLKNSKEGNPRFRIQFTDGTIGTTPRNAGWVYGIHEGMWHVTVKYHFTPKGRCVIDDMLEGDYTPAP